MATERFDYSPWRGGGWYVGNVRYPSGAVGCVSRNYPDGKWRIVCDPRPFAEQPTYRTRDDAARAERDLIASEVHEGGECPKCGEGEDAKGDPWDGLCDHCGWDEAGQDYST